jgi:uncharacterized integral membrane protein
MKHLKLVGVGLLALLLLIVVGQNISPVAVSVLFWGPLELPIALLLFVAALTGFVLGVAVAYVTLRRKSGARAAP